MSVAARAGPLQSTLSVYSYMLQLRYTLLVLERDIPDIRNNVARHFFGLGLLNWLGYNWQMTKVTNILTI